MTNPKNLLFNHVIAIYVLLQCKRDHGTCYCEPQMRLLNVGTYMLIVMT